MLLKRHILFFLFVLLFSITSSHASPCSILFEQQDYLSAVQQCQKEASLNLPDANFILGQLYENGFGVQQNINTSLSYYHKAALDNDVEAQIKLGKYHTKKKNYLQSYVYFSLAIDNGSLRALRYRDKIEQNLSIQELELSRNHFEIVKSAIEQKRT